MENSAILSEDGKSGIDFDVTQTVSLRRWVNEPSISLLLPKLLKKTRPHDSQLRHDVPAAN